MNRTLISTSIVVAILATLLSDAASAHDACEVESLVGTWNLVVTPQSNPDIPVTPPPFTALFSFEVGGTFMQTDTGFHPGSAVELFPDLGPLSASDGWGAWEAAGSNRYRGKFIKNLFSADGAHVGYVITRLTMVVRGNHLEARGDSAFVRGSDVDAAPFFAGGITLATGTRLRFDVR
jgi:hypothetical protein